MSESNEIYEVAAKVARPDRPNNVMDPNIHHFPLRDAYLCQDCENVTNSSTTCPSCTSTKMLGISPFFTHTVEERKRLPPK